ncbi:MAG: tetratricopeptide repeat protein [Candidatus Hodarchaeota archaeon]
MSEFVSPPINNILEQVTILQQSGEIEEAISLLGQTLKSKNYSKKQHLTLLTKLAGLLISQMNYTSAISYFEEALNLSRQLLLTKDEGYCLKDIAKAYIVQGEFEQAQTYLLKCQQIAENLSDGHLEAAALNNLAVIYNNKEDHETARQYYLQALEKYKENKNKIGISRVLNNLGEICRKKGNLIDAITYYQLALTLKRQENHIPGIALVLSNLGLVYLELGQYMPARDAFDESLSFWRLAQSDPHPETLIHTARLHIQENQDFRLALKYLESAKDIAEKSGQILSLISSYLAIGELYFEAKKSNKQARTYYEKAVDLLKKVDSAPILQIQVNLALAVLATHEMDLETAENHLSQASTILSQSNLGNSPLFVQSLIFNTLILSSRFKFGEALTCLKEAELLAKLNEWNSHLAHIRDIKREIAFSIEMTNAYDSVLDFLLTEKGQKYRQQILQDVKRQIKSVQEYLQSLSID